MRALVKTTIVAIALFVGVTVNAQNLPVQFGVKGGVNLSNITDGDNGGDAKVGFNVGITLDYAIASDLYLLTGLEYSMKGMKDSGIKLNLSYLQLPVHVGYKMSMTENTKIVLHAGPYLGYAVDGKWKVGSVSVDAFSDEFNDATEGAVKLGRFDFGLGLGVGLEVDKISIGLGYDFGLTNIYDGSFDGKLRNMNAYLSVGYKF